MRRIILFLTFLILVSGCVQKTEEISRETPKEIPQEKETPPSVQSEESIEEPQAEIKEPEPPKAPEAPKTQVIEKTNWPTFHGDVGRTGFSTSKAPSKPNVLWKLTVDYFEKKGVENFDVGWPIIDNDQIFFSAGDIFSIDLTTGKEAWSYIPETDDFYPRGLVASNDKLFVTVNNDDNLKAITAGFVYALDKKMGKSLWKYKTEKGISHSLPLYADNKVFIGDDSGNIYAIDANSGKLIWKRYLDAAVIHSSPAYENGVMFIGTEASTGPRNIPSYVYALDAKNGEVKWKFESDVVSGKLNLIHSAPAIFDGVVYVGAENGYFYALSSKDGKLIWKNKIASGSDELIGVSAAAALGYGMVFIGTYEGKFLALDQKDGEILWEFPFGKANADSSPALADRKVYFGAGDYFYSLDANTGNLLWKERLGGSSAAFASGILIVQNALVEANLQPQTPVLIAFSEEGKLSLG